MKHPNGFHYTDHSLSDCWGYATPRTIHFALNRKSEQRNPRLTEMTPIRPGVWDRTHKAEVDAVWEHNAKRATLIHARIHRAFSYIQAANRAHLATLTPEEACAAFDLYHATGLNGGSWHCLKWFEVLPPGITEQAAADATGRTFCISRWEQNERGQSVHKGAQYTPGESKPRKSHQVAKRI